MTILQICQDGRSSGGKKRVSVRRRTLRYPQRLQGPATCNCRPFLPRNSSLCLRSDHKKKSILSSSWRADQRRATVPKTRSAACVRLPLTDFRSLGVVETFLSRRPPAARRGPAVGPGSILEAPATYDMCWRTDPHFRRNMTLRAENGSTPPPPPLLPPFLRFLCPDRSLCSFAL